MKNQHISILLFLFVVLLLPFISSIICNPNIPNGCPNVPTEINQYNINNTNITNYLQNDSYYLKSNPYLFYNVSTLPTPSTYNSSYVTYTGATGNVDLGSYSLTSTEANILESNYTKSGVFLRNLYMGGVWARGLLTYRNSSGDDYFSLGAVGVNQTLLRAYLGPAYNTAWISWSNGNTLINTTTDTGQALQVNGGIKGTTFTGNGSGINSVNAELLSGYDFQDFIRDGDTVQMGNYFGGKQFYLNQLDNAYFLADKRFIPDVKIYYANGTFWYSPTSTQVSNLFDGSYESSFLIPAGTYAEVNMSYANQPNGRFENYPYGYFIASAYFTFRLNQSWVWTNNTYAPQGLGWSQSNFTTAYNNVGASYQILSAYQQKFYVTDHNFRFYANTASDSYISELELKLDRMSSTEMPYVDKYRANNLYQTLSLKDNTATTRVSLNPSNGYISSYYNSTLLTNLYTSSAGSLIVNPTTGWTYWNTANKNNAFFIYDSATAGVSNSYTGIQGNALSMTYNGTQTMSLKNFGTSWITGGLFGIGTNVPAYNLDVNSSGATAIRSIGETNPQIRIHDTTNNVITKIQSLDSSGLFGTESNHTLELRTNNVIRAKIFTNGNIVTGNNVDSGYQFDAYGNSSFRGDINQTFGNSTINTYYGGMHFHNDGGVSISLNTTLQKVNLFTDGEYINGFRKVGNDTLQLQVDGGVYEAKYTLQTKGTQSHEYESYLYANEFQENNTYGRTVGQASSETDLQSFGFIRINAGDNVTLRVRDITGTTSGTAYFGNVNLYRVGN